MQGKTPARPHARDCGREAQYSQRYELHMTRSELVVSKPNVLVGRRLLCVAALTVAALGSSACTRMPQVAAAASSAGGDVALRGSDGDPAAPKTIVRTYRGAPSTTVMGWSANEGYQGLRASVRSDGSLVRDHQIFVSAYAVVNLASLYPRNSNWYAFTNGMQNKEQLQLNYPMRDPFNCDGTDECSPLVFFSGRVTDAFLRASRDSIVVKMEEVNGMSETIVTLRADMVGRYLAVVDSVSTVRRKAVAAR